MYVGESNHKDPEICQKIHKKMVKLPRGGSFMNKLSERTKETCFIDVDNFNALTEAVQQSGTRRLVLFHNAQEIQKRLLAAASGKEPDRHNQKIMIIKEAAIFALRSSLRIDWALSESSNWAYRDIRSNTSIKNHQMAGITDPLSSLLAGQFDIFKAFLRGDDIPASTASVNKRLDANKSTTNRQRSLSNFIDLAPEDRAQSLEPETLDEVHTDLLYKFLCASYPTSISALADLEGRKKSKTQAKDEQIYKYGFSFFTHPHSDHCSGFTRGWYQAEEETLPGAVLTRDITYDLAASRYKLNFNREQVFSDLIVPGKKDTEMRGKAADSLCFKVIPSGHCIGANSLIINCGNKIETDKPTPCHTFIASEFRPESYRSKYLSALTFLKPRKCVNLVIDSTFNNPEYRFPPIELEIGRMIDWIRDNIEKHPIAFYAYDYGKAQDLSLILRSADIDQEIPIIFSKKTCRLNDICADHGFAMASQLSKSEARKKKVQKEKPFILIVPRSEKHKGPIRNLKKKRALIDAEVSGWCADPEWREKHLSKEYFTISGHPDYHTLKEFINKCEPSRVVSQNAP